MTPPLFVPALGRSLYPGASVALDFTRNLYRSGTPVVKGSPSLLSGWTFTRDSTGYAETAAGALVAFASGAPRITDKGLLVEEARTNLLLRSQTFDNASWTKTDTTITADSVLAPDGTTTADLATEGSAGTAQIGQAATVSSGATVAVSFYVRRGNTDWIRITCVNGANLFRGWFNLGTGAVGTSTVGGTGILTSASITASVNGFYRVVLVGSIPATTAYSVFINTASADNSGTRVSGGTYYPWGAQLEAGTFPTSYIPTTTASATRALDVAALAFVAPSVGTLVVRASSYAINTNSNMAFAATDGGTTSRIGLYLYPSYTGFIVRNGGVNQADLNAASGAANNTVYTWAGRYAANDFAACRSGGAVVTDVAGTIPSLTDLRFGGLAGTQPLNGYVERAIFYPYAFTDAQLQAATA